MSWLLVLFLVVGGMALGSFLSVVVVRVCEGWDVIGIVKGRSKCPNCRKAIAWYDNLPLVSYCVLGGRCRLCEHTISPMYPLLELGGALALVTAFVFVDGDWMKTAVLGAIFLLMLALLSSDLRYMLLPAEFVYTLYACVLIWLYLTGKLGIDAVLSGVGAWLAFGLIYLVSKGRGMGFGDVEYAGAMGLVLGFPNIMVGMMLAFVAGGLVGGGLLLMRSRGMKDKIPFGPFLIAGTLGAWAWGERIVAWYLSYL